MMRKPFSWWCGSVLGSVFVLGSASLLHAGFMLGTSAAPKSSWLTSAASSKVETPIYVPVNSVAKAAAVKTVAVKSPVAAVKFVSAVTQTKTTAAKTAATTTVAKAKSGWSSAWYNRPGTPGGGTKPVTPPAPPKPPTPPKPPAPIVKPVYVDAPSISGFVYLDTNRNGKKDRGEFAIGNALIQLIPKSNPSHPLYVYTKADGSYHFGSLPVGTYSLAGLSPLYKQFKPSADSLGSFVNNKGQAIYPPAITYGALTPGKDLISNITLGAKQAAVNYLFAEYSLDPKYISKRYFLSSTTPTVWTPIVAVPEPGTWSLLAAGAAILGTVIWRRKRQPALA